MVLDRIIELAADKLHVSSDKISEESNILEDLGADSIDLVELIMAAESEFKVNFDDDSLAQIKTIGDLVKFIEKANKKK
jgi:acyl carrier protein